MGSDGFVFVPTLGKRKLDMFQVMGFPDGSKVKFESSTQSTVSAKADRLSVRYSSVVISADLYVLISSCENLKPLN